MPRAVGKSPRSCHVAREKSRNETEAVIIHFGFKKEEKTIWFILRIFVLFVCSRIFKCVRDAQTRENEKVKGGKHPFPIRKQTCFFFPHEIAPAGRGGGGGAITHLAFIEWMLPA